MTNIKQVYDALLKAFGHQNWWPTITGNKETEVILGAILTQNTSWKNVEKAMTSMASEGMIDFRRIATEKREKVARLIKPSGYYNQKAERLQLFAKHIVSNYNGNIKLLLTNETKQLRSELLGIKGIGPETADSIMLYAAEKASFVVDTYTKRIFSRMGLCSDSVSYDELQNLIVNNLPNHFLNASTFKQYHALLVQLGKGFCVKSKPKCHSCPLSKTCKLGRQKAKV